MNWLDVILIILFIIIFGCGIAWLIMAVSEKEYATGFGGLFASFITIIFISFATVVVIDKRSGSTIGEITSVDKNYFGTTAVYLKVNNNSEEKYCIEDKELAKQANELIGEKVIITYGKRIGIYSTGACNQAPISIIEPLEDN